jgi:hypothetical protein
MISLERKTICFDLRANFSFLIHFLNTGSLYSLVMLLSKSKTLDQIFIITADHARIPKFKLDPVSIQLTTIKKRLRPNLDSYPLFKSTITDLMSQSFKSQSTYIKTDSYQSKIPKVCFYRQAESVGWDLDPTGSIVK